MSHALHFVGFRYDKNQLQWANAVAIWGEPDFVHMWNDVRTVAMTYDGDILIYANKSQPDMLNDYTYDDSWVQ